jgi:uncharacterized protein
MSKVRYVFDTNVIVSALLFENGKPALVLRYALANGDDNGRVFKHDRA